ncbi:MAG: T9SS type A sorting domain-containing protein [Ferruginibacter sp.]
MNTVTVPFTVNNDAASFATDRFMIVFSKPSGPLPIDISSIKAYEKNNGIQVDWMMSTEQDMDKYEVEKSTDGRHFIKTGTVLSKGNSNIQVNYGWFDANPAFGDNFYRIRAIEKAGTYKYSDIVRVNIGKGISTGISMYPNPFEGNGFNLQLNKFAAGTYTLTMYNSIGQQVYNTTLTHGGGSATQFISLGKDLAAGTYTVKINGEGTTLTRTITKK